MQRQRNTVEGVQQAIKGMQALVSVEGLEREVKVGRQNRGFGNESCSHENSSFSRDSAAELPPS